MNAQNAEYLLVGGFAVGYHGYPRATGDIDIWIATNPVNAEKVSAALQDFGFNRDNVPAELFLTPGPMLRIGNPPLRIEILTDISGVTFADCWATREVDVMDGVTVNIMSADNLKANKKASGRYKDLNDLEHLP